MKYNIVLSSKFYNLISLKDAHFSPFPLLLLKVTLVSFLLRIIKSPSTSLFVHYRGYPAPQLSTLKLT